MIRSIYNDVFEIVSYYYYIIAYTRKIPTKPILHPIKKKKKQTNNTQTCTSNNAGNDSMRTRVQTSRFALYEDYSRFCGQPFHLLRLAVYVTPSSRVRMCTFWPRNAVKCFYVSQNKPATIALHSTDWFVCITKTECSLHGTNWVFSTANSSLKG